MSAMREDSQSRDKTADPGAEAGDRQSQPAGWCCGLHGQLPETDFQIDWVLILENFFIVFEILCACTADVDHQVQVGAEYFDEFLSKMIIGAINGGQFSVDKCIPLFARHLHLRNKDTKKLTLRWIHTFAESLIGAPLLEFLHLFLYDIFAMLAKKIIILEGDLTPFIQNLQYFKDLIASNRTSND